MAYTKQTWNDLPNTTTPVTATRLNHIEDGIYDAHNLVKSSISIQTSADGTSTSAFGTVAAITNTEFLKVGNKLYLSSNSVKVGEGVSRVRVSGVLSANFVNSNSSNSYTVGARIMKNGTAITLRALITIKPSETLNTCISITPFVIDVSENDLIQIGVYSSTGNVSKKALDGTYLFVEET